MGTMRIPFGGGVEGGKKFCLERLSLLAKLFHAFVFKIEQVLGTVKFVINISLASVLPCFENFRLWCI
jgi:hypothetical protein